MKTKTLNLFAIMFIAIIFAASCVKEDAVSEEILAANDSGDFVFGGGPDVESKTIFDGTTSYWNGGVSYPFLGQSRIRM